jgi:mRNA-degrading endonuclease toxin of MazEF toxin-antitoxin module
VERGDIYLISLDPTQGHEQQGRPPVLVVSPGAFDRLTKVPIVLPITNGGNLARTLGFTGPLTGAGTRTAGVVRCDQPRALDLDARGGRKLESVPGTIIEEVLRPSSIDGVNNLTHSGVERVSSRSEESEMVRW